jgi:hypothetical protein
MHSSCKLGRRSKRRSTQRLQSTPKSFLRSTKRHGKPPLLKGKGILKTWQRQTTLITKDK